MTLSDFLQQVNPDGEISVFTDGACSGNPGPGGWGVVMRQGLRLQTELNGGELSTTNNRMELCAAIQALQTLGSNKIISITTDSQYVKNGITQWLPKWKANGWKTTSKAPVKNQDLWTRLDELCQGKKITWNWIKGHNGSPDNEKADTLARQATVMQMVSGH